MATSEAAGRVQQGLGLSAYNFGILLSADGTESVTDMGILAQVTPEIESTIQAIKANPAAFLDLKGVQDGDVAALSDGLQFETGDGLPTRTIFDAFVKGQGLRRIIPPDE
ncbi:MAG: hypothetical protein AAFN94_00910 [Pseudomonadota bacterium]